MDDAELRREYDRRKKDLDQITSQAKLILKKRLERASIKVDDITGRVKEFESFQKKYLPRLAMGDPFQVVRDLAGVRVICLFRTDIERVAGVIKEAFNVLEEENKTETDDPSTFGYMGTHYIVKMDSRCGDHNADIMGKPFEIQVRTISQHAWAAISHHLRYKSVTDVPSHLRKDFNALSGMFYVADKHFEFFFKQREEQITKIEKQLSQKDPILDLELNIDNLRSYLKIALPYRDDEENMLSIFFDLIVNEVKTIKDIHDMLHLTYDLAVKFEEQIYPGFKSLRSYIMLVCSNIAFERNFLAYLRTVDQTNSMIDRDKKRAAELIIKLREIYIQRITPSLPPGTSSAAP